MNKKEQQKNQFVYYWYKVFKWKENPFDKKNLDPITNYISGYQDERKKLNYFVIEKQRVAYIYGEDGFGKSLLLNWLLYQLKRYQDRITADFIDKNVKFNDLVKFLVKPFLNFKEKTIIASNIMNLDKITNLIKDDDLKSIYQSVYLKKKQFEFDKLKNFLNLRLERRHLVLLIDDFEKLDENNVTLINKLIDSDINLQIIITFNKDHLEHAKPKGDSLKVHLTGLNFESALGMISKRIMSVGGIGYEPFEKEKLRSLYEKTNKSPKEILNSVKKLAIKKALDNINHEEETLETPISKEEVKIEDIKTDTETKENSYEIKVVDHAKSKPYSIKIVDSKKKSVDPVKVDKPERT